MSKTKELKSSAGSQIQNLNTVRKCIYMVSNFNMFAGLQDGQEKKENISKEIF